MKLGFEAWAGFGKHSDVLWVGLRNTKGSQDVAVSSLCCHSKGLETQVQGGAWLQVGFCRKVGISHLRPQRTYKTHISFAFVFVLSISVYCMVICKMDLGMEELKKEAGNKTGNSSCCNMIREQLFLCWLWSSVRREEFLERLSRNPRGCAYRFDIMNASLERLETMPRCSICRVNRVEMSLV